VTPPDDSPDRLQERGETVLATLQTLVARRHLYGRYLYVGRHRLPDEPPSPDSDLTVTVEPEVRDAAEVGSRVRND
jgi:hypothetical protein